MADVFELLADPGRRRLVELMQGGERSVGELVAATGASQPAVSRNLRLLREGGLVAVRAEGQKRFYRVLPERLKELDAWLEPYRLVWSSRLDELERHLDDMDDRAVDTGGRDEGRTAGAAGGRKVAAALRAAVEACAREGVARTRRAGAPGGVDARADGR